MAAETDFGEFQVLLLDIGTAPPPPTYPGLINVASDELREFASRVALCFLLASSSHVPHVLFVC